MKTGSKLVLGICTLFVIMACGALTLPGETGGSLPTIVAGTLGALTPPGGVATEPSAVTEAPAQGTPINFSGIAFTIPSGLAMGARCENVPAVDEQSGAPWDVAPAHIRCVLQGYPVEGAFFEPTLYIYPAIEYAAASDGAASSIQKVQTILANPSPSLGDDALPHLPWANAAQVFAAQPLVVQMQGGGGVRVLTQYAQYTAPANNHDLFYHFEGVVANGSRFIVATLPTNAAFLAASSDPNAPIPPDGIAFPPMDNTSQEVWDQYYQTVVSRLSTTTPESFVPSLTMLDNLMQSLSVTP